MRACEALTETATAGVVAALRAVDCLANETAAGAFGRLFGAGGNGGGALMPALTIILTLYIAFFAVSLLTGRSRLGISALTPRMMTLGLVLTFVTSWVAYQSVVWNLAVGAPDQIAGILMGAQGSATELFGSRVDVLLGAIAEIGANAGSTPQSAAGTFTPINLMWLAALMMLLGTVGVLVTARIALAVLLVLGPVFIVLALFKGTRGLFAGWVRGVVLTALAPLFAVLGGGFMLELAVPVIGRMQGAEGIDATAVMALFLIAAAHIALMSMVLSVLGTMVSNWSVFGLGRSKGRDERPAPSPASTHSVAAAPAAAIHSNRRSLGMAAFAPTVVETSPHAVSSRVSVIQGSSIHPAFSAGAPSPLLAVSGHRARGIGSRFRAVSNQPRGKIR